jgi:dihydropyrimidinase
MAEYDMIVLNGVVVTDEETRELDIAIKGGKIAKLVPRGVLSSRSAGRVIDAERGMVMVSLWIP